jgi:hypothetical protein
MSQIAVRSSFTRSAPYTASFDAQSAPSRFFLGVPSAPCHVFLAALPVLNQSPLIPSLLTGKFGGRGDPAVVLANRVCDRIDVDESG